MTDCAGRASGWLRPGKHDDGSIYLREEIVGMRCSPSAMAGPEMHGEEQLFPEGAISRRDGRKKGVAILTQPLDFCWCADQELNQYNFPPRTNNFSYSN
jgi:hypothetical protein